MASSPIMTNGIRAEDPSSAGAFFSINYQPDYRNLAEPRPLPPPKMQSTFFPVTTYQSVYWSPRRYGDYLAAEETPATKPPLAAIAKEERHPMAERIVQKLDEMIETLRSMTASREVRSRSEAAKTPPLTGAPSPLPAQAITSPALPQASDLAVRHHNPAITGRSISTPPPPLLNRSAAVPKSNQFESESVNPSPILSVFTIPVKKTEIPNDNNGSANRPLHGSETRSAISVKFSAGFGKAGKDKVDDDKSIVMRKVEQLLVNDSSCVKGYLLIVGLTDWGGKYSPQLIEMFDEMLKATCSMKCSNEFQVVSSSRCSTKWLEYDKRVSKI
ncbi:hypothetical protein CASFOL_028527 [Castilleja foliolosa]|uniref:Uncharacterized protein n=1 Tax=Castilleja foliolosa TaxID=1961234 RepID=A0ABD3CC74_9LAMI